MLPYGVDPLDRLDTECEPVDYVGCVGTLSILALSFVVIAALGWFLTRLAAWAFS